ncbi:hypothetical protein ACLINY_29185 (plasmid) [Bacillus thuringiensis]|uniref:hypothetical protein n=1 Tax=Bacillus thuringiensis TaxID=1428 RepID=UPI0039882F7C
MADNVQQKRGFIINPFKDKKLTYWLVNLGNMYYAGGLLRKKDNESTFSYEFVNN